jgi:hypothetical protein
MVARRAQGPDWANSQSSRYVIGRRGASPTLDPANGAGCTEHGNYSLHLLNTIAPFVPPNPNEFESA